ncbi:ABC transporter permease [Cohnella zeiphila]|uniref:ABC transporter permease n=1 Tax=Cohnella zeiphila TaxID=2761120 RepID=A0A7X0VXB1_9BACL|nr:ABC transporter permease [Cohnella zeiphila]MBB6734094.1 ABC transporter permease [Cohnella zeiphila]
MESNAGTLSHPLSEAGRAKAGANVRDVWKEKGGTLVAGLLLPAFAIAIWQTAGSLGWISARFLPDPYTILKTFRELAATGELGADLGISLQRAAIGFLFGGSLGLLLGLLNGFSKTLDGLLDPTLQMIRMVPHLAVSPLIILWLGFDETSKIVIIALGAFFPLYLNTYLGIRMVDRKLIEVSQVLAYPRRKVLTRLILPAALPNILLGLRLSLAVSWLGLVVAELIGSQSGIGFLINIGKQDGVPSYIFVGVILFAVVGKLVDSFVQALERRLLKWNDSYLG